MKKNKKNSATSASLRLCESKFGKIFILIFFVLTLFGCERIKEVYGKKEAGGADGVIDAPVFAVNTMLAVKGPIQDYLTFSGDIIAGSTVDVLPEAAGRVAELYVSVGRRVNRGDRIAAIDPSRPGMSFRHSVATAPISGTIVMMPAQVGMMVNQAVPLARIAGGGGLEIKLFVAERFISKMELNLPCEVTLDAWPGEIFRGSISEISPTVDPTSRTMEVRVNVNNPGSKLKAGMFAKVKVVTEQKDNIVKIPAMAVINRFGERYIFVVDYSDPENPVVRKRVITQGILIDGVLEVSDGLSPDEELVIRGMSLLQDGSRVNVIEQLTPLGVTP